MTAAATPRGRPQYAALRDEIASSASGGRKTTSYLSPRNAAPKRRAADATPRRKAAILAALERPPLAMAEKQLNQTRPLSKCPAFSHLATNRDRRSRGAAAPHRLAPVPLGTQRLDFSLNNSRKLRPKTCDSQQPRSKIARVAATPRGASYIHCVHSAQPLAATR